MTPNVSSPSAMGASSRCAPLALCGGVPLAFYLATLSGDGYWLDSGEFVAASIRLDIAHPPGHPLAALYGKLWSFVPLGSLPFRIGLGQAVAAALGCVFLCRAIETALVRASTPPGLRVPIALVGTWIAGLSYGYWFQAVRPEVYALQAALLLAALERLVQLDLGAPRPDPRPLYTACLLTGLGLTNHHLMSLLFMLPLAYAALLTARDRGARVLGRCTAIGALAMLPYVYLPVRAAAHPPQNLGDPSTFDNFLWVLSARVYAREKGLAHSQSVADGLADLLAASVEQLHGIFLATAIAGLYLSLRAPALRLRAVLFALALASTLGVRPLLAPLLGPVRGNPDSFGYLLVGWAAAGAFTSFLLWAVASVLEDRGVRLLRAGTLALCAVLLAIALGVTWPNVDLHALHAPRILDRERLSSLPPRSVVIATSAQTVFRYWDATATERERPDIELITTPFAGYPGALEAARRRSPMLRELATGLARSKKLEVQPVLALARRRPVFVELDPRVPEELYPYLSPRGLLFEVEPEGAGPLNEAAATSEARIDRLYDALGAETREPETARQLLWTHYMSAVLYAARGARPLAARELERARRLFPDDTMLARLGNALASSQGPIDVTPLIDF